MSSTEVMHASSKKQGPGIQMSPRCDFGIGPHILAARIDFQLRE